MIFKEFERVHSDRSASIQECNHENYIELHRGLLQMEQRNQTLKQDSIGHVEASMVKKFGSLNLGIQAPQGKSE